MRPARAIAWACAAHVLSLAGFSTYPTLLPRLQSEWGMNNSEAGFLSGIFFAGYMAAVPVLTSLTDRLDARRIYLASSAVAALAVVGLGTFAGGFFTAALFQLLSGVGIAGTYMPGLRILTDHSSGTAQVRAVSFYTAIFGMGAGVSIVLAGVVADAWGWRTAFLTAALGPAAAGAMMVLGFPATRPAHRPLASVLDFRPVLRQREVRPYLFGYGVHCWELFGSRSWLVAFLVFAQTQLPAGQAAAISPVVVAAVANLLGPPSSIVGNEIAMRFGRNRTVWIAMLASGAASCSLGWTAMLPWAAIAAAAFAHVMLMMGDSSAMTAAVVTRSDPRIRGATMALHSMLGFGCGFVSPLVFGAVLDLSGGNANPVAWRWAFLSLGILCVIYALRLAAAGKAAST